MTPRATFYPKLETNFTDFNTADLQLNPTYKMTSWSLKMWMYGLNGPYAMTNAYLAQMKDGPSVIKFLKSVYTTVSYIYYIQFFWLFVFLLRF